MKKEPKISIVTAVFNGDKYLEKCLQSIANQTYANYEHIIMDGGSTDRTIEILKKYEETYNMKWFSAKDNGMYDAIINGFDKATGEIYCWLNSDDMYMPWALESVVRVMSYYKVEWLMGFPCYWDDTNVCRCQYGLSSYTRFAIRQGLHDGRCLPFIQQESTFWTRELWEKAKGDQIRKYKNAGDFFLWKRFAKYSPLYLINSPLSGFRHHVGQKSEDKTSYYNELGHESKILWLINKSRVVKLLDRILSSFNLKHKLYLQNIDVNGENNESN